MKSKIKNLEINEIKILEFKKTKNFHTKTLYMLKISLETKRFKIRKFKD